MLSLHMIILTFCENNEISKFVLYDSLMTIAAAISLQEGGQLLASLISEMPISFIFKKIQTV